MKIAISGKGGVGKSTLAGAIALTLSKRGDRVLALDSDSDANLASAIGMPHAEQEKIVPISQQIALIEERTGAKVDEYGKVFKLNPEVSDVADKFATKHNGVELIVLGAIKNGGGGCACPENTFIKALVTDLVLYKNESLIMDMEAGIEHLGRATSRGVDVLLVVVEPGQRSIDCAKSVIKLANDIGLKKLIFVGNKIDSKTDEDFIKTSLNDQKFAAMIPYSNAIRKADRDGVSVLDIGDANLEKAVGDILKMIEEVTV